MADVSPNKQEAKQAQHLDKPTLGDVHLHYPQITLQTSFASLLSSSFPTPIRSQHTTMPASEHSLSESWTSLSEADYTQDEDSRSEATGIVSLLGANASEDSQSEAEHGDTDEVDGDDQEHEQEPAAACFPESAELATPLQMSITQLRDAQPYESTSSTGTLRPNAIKFDEAESWPITGRVDLIHSVKVFNEKEKADLARYIPKVHRAAQLHGTIRMTTSRSSIRSDRPFRLLYSGCPLATETRSEILKKVGDVLVAGPDLTIRHGMSASRYHVIPSEFGPGSSPNYAELIPLRFQQMIVDECITAEAFKQDSAHSQIQLKYKGGQSVRSLWDGATYRVPRGSGWDPPDLAIIFVRERDDTQRQLFSGRLNEFTSRHHIPTLIVRDDNDWSTSYDYLVPDRRSLHMCVESRATGVLQLLPIDRSSFINLDAGQLNKHIACLCVIYDQDADRQKIALRLRQTQESQGSAADVEKNLSKSIVARNQTKTRLFNYEDHINELWPVLLTSLLAVLGLLFCTRVLVFSAAYLGGVTSMNSIAPSTTAHSVQPPMSMATTTAAMPTIIASLSTKSPQIEPSTVGVTAPSMDKELARLVSDAAAVHNNSDKFQVQILGDGHVIVKAPQRLLGRKRTAKITISVMRGSIEVASNTSQLFEGVYTVKIDRQHANGLLNVTISVKKPCITETYELDFGQPWKPADALRNIVKQFWQPLQKQVDLIAHNPRAAISQVLGIGQENVQAVSTFGMAKIRNTTAHYGPMVREISLATHKKLVELCVDVVYHSSAAAQAVGRETQVELQQLRAASNVASQRATALMHKLLADMSTRMTKLRDHAISIDLDDIRDKFVPSQTMAKAQERAHKIADDVTKKVRTGRERAKAGQAMRGKTLIQKQLGKREGKKREGKKPWHNNMRVNVGRINVGW